MNGQIPEGTVIDGRYRVLQRIGSGGMADVYCAEDTELDRRIALKLLHRRFAEDPNFVERFRREASSAAGLQHPNIVSVYDRGSWDGTYYIAMEYLPGRNLKQVLLEEGPLEPSRAVDLALQILAAAGFAHSRGIVHRDLKPHNVIVDQEGCAKVTDFGIAYAGSSDITATGSVMGTAHYLSPEQAQGQPVTASSDIYAVGVVLFELLTGRPPFDAEAAVAVALKHVSEPPPGIRELNPGISAELESIVLRALEKDPARRFATTEEFGTALKAAQDSGLLQHEGNTAGGQSETVLLGAASDTGSDYGGEGEVSGQPASSRRWLWVTLVAVLVVAGAGLTYLLTRTDTRQVPDTVGRGFAAAAAILANAGFEVEQERVESTSPSGRVIRQDPQPFTEVEVGSTVTLIVSDGPGERTVPDVEGLAQSTASRRLRRAGFKVRVSKRFSSSVPAGRAVRTSPAAGIKLERGEEVTLIVSQGVEQVEVPDLIGQSQSSASAELESSSLKASISEQESDRPAGTVLAQDPAAGSSVAKGSTVQLTVAKEPETVAVPDVEGFSQDRAATVLSAAGFTVVFRTREVTDEADDGKVVRQLPSSGSRVKDGAQVTVTVGKLAPDSGSGDETNSPPDATGGTLP